MGQGALARILSAVPPIDDPNVLVGNAQADDAAVYRLSDEAALVSTLDFFTPIVDDAFQFGAIAAANALSDVYAMGGEPRTALNIACFPQSGVPLEILSDILRGGLAKAEEAGVVVVGGHTVIDEEIKFGMAVTGVIHPNEILTNARAKTEDRLVLTKPLGTGIIGVGLVVLLVGPLIGKEFGFIFFFAAFMASSVPGSVLAYFLLKTLKRTKVLEQYKLSEP